MGTESKRLTFVVTPEIEGLLAKAKKELFYDQTQSAMIRELLMAGLNVVEHNSAREIPDETK